MERDRLLQWMAGGIGGVHSASWIRRMNRAYVATEKNTKDKTGFEQSILLETEGSTGTRLGIGQSFLKT